MANEKLKKAAGPLKIAGGVLCLAASIGLMWHRMPKHEYVAVHEDKPRPKTETSQAAVPALAKPAEKATAAPAAAAKPVSAAPVRPAATADFAAPPPPAAEGYDWRDDCKSEIGILCHSVPPKGLARCLEPYSDVLLSACRGALSGRPTSSAKP